MRKLAIWLADVPAFCGHWKQRKCWHGHQVKHVTTSAMCKLHLDPVPTSRFPCHKCYRGEHPVAAHGTRANICAAHCSVLGTMLPRRPCGAGASAPRANITCSRRGRRLLRNGSEAGLPFYVDLVGRDELLGFGVGNVGFWGGGRRLLRSGSEAGLPFYVDLVGRD